MVMGMDMAYIIEEHYRYMDNLWRMGLAALFFTAKWQTRKGNYEDISTLLLRYFLKMAHYNSHIFNILIVLSTK